MAKVTIIIEDNGLPHDNPAATYQVSTVWDPDLEDGQTPTVAQTLGMGLQMALLQNPDATQETQPCG